MKTRTASLISAMGQLIQVDGCSVFFGGKAAGLEKLYAVFDEAPCLLKQVHGDTLVRATRREEKEADAHWTTDENRVLMIKTADCLPVMAYAPDKRIAVAIHAGWRGVQKKTVSQALTTLNIASDPGLKVWIGPHIQWQSFRVDQDVAEEILDSHYLKWANGTLQPKHHQFDDFSKNLAAQKAVLFRDPKFHINLSLLVLWELFLCGVKTDQVSVSRVDTKVDTEFFSFRRGEKDVRNYSFIVLS